MAQSKKLNEKHDKILRELSKREDNKICFDCPAKGPCYVNLHTNTFVCEHCSGLLREFNFRVKSISASSFTPQEIKALEEGGNEIAARTWLANARPGEIKVSIGDTSSIREYMNQKYVHKKWYKSVPQQSITAEISSISKNRDTPGLAAPISQSNGNGRERSYPEFQQSSQLFTQSQSVRANDTIKPPPSKTELSLFDTLSTPSTSVSTGQPHDTHANHINDGFSTFNQSAATVPFFSNTSNNSNVVSQFGGINFLSSNPPQTNSFFAPPSNVTNDFSCGLQTPATIHKTHPIIPTTNILPQNVNNNPFMPSSSLPAATSIISNIQDPYFSLRGMDSNIARSHSSIFGSSENNSISGIATKPSASSQSVSTMNPFQMSSQSTNNSIPAPLNPFFVPINAQPQTPTATLNPFYIPPQQSNLIPQTSNTLSLPITTSSTVAGNYSLAAPLPSSLPVPVPRSSVISNPFEASEDRRQKLALLEDLDPLSRLKT